MNHCKSQGICLKNNGINEIEIGLKKQDLIIDGKLVKILEPDPIQFWFQDTYEYYQVDITKLKIDDKVDEIYVAVNIFSSTIVGIFIFYSSELYINDHLLDSLFSKNKTNMNSFITNKDTTKRSLWNTEDNLTIIRSYYSASNKFKLEMYKSESNTLNPGVKR